MQYLLVYESDPDTGYLFGSLTELEDYVRGTEENYGSFEEEIYVYRLGVKSLMKKTNHGTYEFIDIEEN